MKRAKDNRITGRYMGLKEYAVLLLVLAGFSGFHMVIYQAMYQSGLLEENVRRVINMLMLYVMIMAAIATIVIGLIRYRFFIDPMKKLSEAAREIAKGDFSVRIPPLRTDGKKSFIDVLYDDFNIMATELASIETLKNDFIANVSHEIKTPLSVIQTYTIALQNNNTSEEERKENTQTILDATQKLSALVTNILKLSKLENQEIIGEVKPFNLSEQLRRCILSFLEMIEAKDIRFEEDMDEVDICYDENILEIVWNNLLSNAIKFCSRGDSITVNLKVKKDSISHYVQISVKDTGCGMDETTQKRIFDKFYQGDMSHTSEGNGLGLALAKKALDLLGGIVMVESTLGQGSTFTVCLKI